ncbi:ventricular zone-expressed PH domain-containing protein homolog 1 isoform X1 [Hirundo rustica]|uniref:ventricular zone-expressed PH domain-containing protein homolog 1 isoform X1 n=1 Tax=Hirundo rustica TaxID=43150 RepID=UPI0026728374|nr:ventricular zone-expressed PH domain-containing protein homolog 1 isoform X1 [Hirundo rustica]
MFLGNSGGRGSRGSGCHNVDVQLCEIHSQRRAQALGHVLGSSVGQHLCHPPAHHVAPRAAGIPRALSRHLGGAEHSVPQVKASQLPREGQSFIKAPSRAAAVLLLPQLQDAPVGDGVSAGHARGAARQLPLRPQGRGAVLRAPGAAQVQPLAGKDHVSGSQLVLGTPHGEHGRVPAQVQLDLVGVELGAVGEDDGFVQGLGHLEPDAGSEGAQGHSRGGVDAPKDLPRAHGEQNCGFTAWKGLRRLSGNSMLLRVLPALYEQQPQPIRARLRDLVAPMAQLDPPEQLHLLRLLHTVARKRELGVLKECLPFLFGHLRDPNHSEVILNILLEISSYEPAALAPFLPTLREIGESFPSLIGQTAKIFGAVGHLDEERARTSLLYLVNQLASMEHSFHHILLLEIKSLTDTFSSILGAQSRDIYRMSNSFSAIARLLVRQLDTDGAAAARMENDPEAECPVPLDDLKSVVNSSEEDEKLQVKIQAFEEKINVDNSTPGSARRYSLGQVSKEERKDMRFNRSKSLALHALRMKGLSSEGGENGEIPAGISFSEICLSQEHQMLPFGVHPEAVHVGNSLVSPQSADYPQAASLPRLTPEKAVEGRAEAATGPVECQDKLYLHLKENLGKVKEYVLEMGRRIPIPEQCVVEGETSPRFSPCWKAETHRGLRNVPGLEERFLGGLISLLGHLVTLWGGFVSCAALHVFSRSQILLLWYLDSPAKPGQAEEGGELRR